MNGYTIKDLSEHTDFIPVLATWHFTRWGELTGAATEAAYADFLRTCVSTQRIPSTLVAIRKQEVLGSVNLVACDMQIRPELTPWLAHLYVHEEERNQGIGSALVRAAVERSRKLGFSAFYLYTSGTLPSYYEHLGWAKRETVLYKGRERTIMQMNLFSTGHMTAITADEE